MEADAYNMSMRIVTDFRTSAASFPSTKQVARDPNVTHGLTDYSANSYINPSSPATVLSYIVAWIANGY